MRGFRRLILLFFFVVIGIPLAIGGAALVKDGTPPTYLENFDYTNYDVKVEMQNKLESIALYNMLGNKKIYVDEETINKIIYTNAKGFEDVYIKITDTESINVKGLWVKFDNNQLSLYTLLNYQGVETTLTLKIGVNNIDNGLKIQLDTFKVGQMPLPKTLFSYILNSLEDYIGFDLRDEYKIGEINYDELYLTVNDSFIKELIEKNLETNFVLFDSIQLEKGNFIINYKFNDSSEYKEMVEAIDKTISVVHTVINDPTLVTEVESYLDLNNPSQVQLKEDFKEVVTLLQDKINNPDNLGDLTEDDIQLFNSLASNFIKLDQDVKNNIVQTIENKILNTDPTLKNEINEAIQAIGNDDIKNLSDLLNQTLGTTYTN